MILFDDGDYLCFRGRVDIAGAAPAALSIEVVIAHRFRETSARRRAYGRLVPGAAMRVSPESLRSAAGDWDEPLRRDIDYDLISFAPA
jgi:hypothetical protein